MRPAIRTPIDEKNEEYSDNTALLCEDEHRTRQEFKDESDINNILRNFGLDKFRRERPLFTEVDYTIDLQTAHNATREVAEAHSRLPEKIRKQYPTPASLFAAIERGEVTAKTFREEEPPRDTGAATGSATGGTG